MKFYVHITSYSAYNLGPKEIAIRRLDADGKLQIWNYGNQSSSKTWLRTTQALPNANRLVGEFDTFEEAITHCLGIPELNEFASRFV